MLQRVCSCAAQPQSSTKEPCTALLLRQDVDRQGQTSSASSESGSLELLLSLDALVGATICGARTREAGQVERAARCNRRQDGDMLTPCGHVPVKVAMSYAARPAQRRRPRVRRFMGPYPVHRREISDNSDNRRYMHRGAKLHVVYIYIYTVSLSPYQA